MESANSFIILNADKCILNTKHRAERKKSDLKKSYWKANFIVLANQTETQVKLE